MFAKALPSRRESGLSSVAVSSWGTIAVRTGGETQPGDESTSLYSGNTLFEVGGDVSGLGIWFIGESDLRDSVSGTTWIFPGMWMGLNL